MTKQHKYIPSTSNIMLQVILACIPAVITLTYFYGLGIIYNILWTIIFAVIAESLFIFARFYNTKNVLNLISNNIFNYSAILSAILLSLCLPPNFDIFKILIGIIFAIIIAKQIYGGLGHNIFNPAMVGFIVLLIAYPQSFTNWPQPHDFIININADDLSQATPLDPAFNNNFNIIYIHYIINIAWFVGGIYLLYKKIIPLVLPLGFLLGIVAASSLIYLCTENAIYNPVSELFLGGTIMGAFFIITDPVTASTTPIGRWIYSILAGIFCMIIRQYAGYPDGVAFAVLFMNVWVPLINKLTIRFPN